MIYSRNHLFMSSNKEKVIWYIWKWNVVLFATLLRYRENKIEEKH